MIVDDFSTYTWVLFLAHKNAPSMSFQSFVVTISCIRSDHGREFENADFENFCDEYGIENNVSVPRTPQQNGVS